MCVLAIFTTREMATTNGAIALRVNHMDSIILMWQMMIAILIAMLGGFFWLLGKKENYKLHFGYILSEVLISGVMGVLVTVLVRGIGIPEYVTYGLSLGFGWIAPWAFNNLSLLKIGGKNKFIMSSIQLNRIYAVILYILFTIITLMTIIECSGFEVHYHLPIFLFNVIAYTIGMVAAIRFWLDVEVRTLWVCLILGTLSFIVNVIVLWDLGPNVIGRSIIIIILHDICLLNRLMCVKWLHQKADEFLDATIQRGGVVE